MDSRLERAAGTTVCDQSARQAVRPSAVWDQANEATGLLASDHEWQVIALLRTSG
jgi:hypothetical protein